jgi:hypothetical protein
MRAIPAWILTAALGGAGTAFAVGSPIADETPVSKDAVAAPAAKEKQAEREFKPPKSYRVRQRGSETVYCKKDRTIGSRLATEKCYNEAQLRDHLLVVEQELRTLEQHRSACFDPERCVTQ